MNNEMLIERIKQVNPAPNDSDTGFSSAALLAVIDERNAQMQTQKPERDVRDSGPKTRRGILVAVAAFVVVILAGVIFLVVQPQGEVADDPTTTTTQATTTTIEAQAAADPRLEAALNGATDVAAEFRYVATVEPWEPQLVYVTGGPQCQIPADTVQFSELDTLTSEQAMLRLTNGDIVGAVEVVRFTDPAVAAEAAPILQRLLESRRECITDSLTSNLGSAFTNFDNQTIPVDDALGAFLVTYEHDDGSGRTAYVQVAAGIQDDLMYVISFSSNSGPVDNGFLADLYFISTDAAK